MSFSDAIAEPAASGLTWIAPAIQAGTATATSITEAVTMKRWRKKRKKKVQKVIEATPAEQVDERDWTPWVAAGVAGVGLIAAALYRRKGKKG